MASLRRPSAAIKPGSGTSRQSASLPRPDDRQRDARKSKVGEKIKKRLSMRYAGNEPLLSVAPPLPGDPRSFLASDPYQNTLSVSQPGDEDDVEGESEGESKFGLLGSPQFAQSGFGTGTNVQDEKIGRRGGLDQTQDEEWDLAELEKDGVDINAFLKRTLTGADDEEVKRFKAAVMRHKQKTAKELQRSVFKNYAEFVVISKEISTLENDMLELKELLTEWKEVPQLMGMEDTLAPTLNKDGTLERRRTQRNSVIDLQNMYKTQLSTLWSTVEGSQKYLPLIPGRHLVSEAHNFVELNAATYKAKQSVSMFLLNDLLLIAGRRRSKNSIVAAGEDRERGRMVAGRCWVLADLVVVDVKDSGDLTNALKIRRGKEVCVYRTQKPEDKKALLGAFRQVSQELGEKKRKDSEKEQERRKSMWQGETSRRVSRAPSFPALLTPGRPISMIGTSMADTKDLRWIDEFGDDLTMAIATRDWDEAVKLVEKGKDLLKTVSSNPSALSHLTSSLDQLTPNLLSAIAYDLSSPELRKSSTTELISYLVRLERGDLARQTFLKSRHDLMLKRVRGIKFEGDISIYVSELAIVCFTIIRHTSDWYQSAFKDNKMASGFVTWAKEQIETFSDLFRRQVYAPSIEESVADECIRVAASHNRKLLRDVGLDFTFLLSTLLRPDPTSSTPLPIFQSNTIAATPAPGYHIESSPYVPFVPDTPAPPIAGTTQPLQITPRSPRHPTVSSAGPVTPGGSAPGSPVPPPRSERRARPPPRPPMEESPDLR
ncbi:exocyst complex component 8, partial [Tremellales sp. Uapishka_1]